ncbi:MAG: RecQ family ATP-dependent DNA helicase [Planctomycetota bacterium]
MTADHLREALQQHFGFAEFRGKQEAVIRHFLAGGSALVVMATGEGKSLCYQLPALVAPGLTLVVSPLIALMNDQVAGLQRRSIAATCIHSLHERHEREARLAAVERGEVRMLYVTPERFRVPGFLELVKRIGVARLAIDEAHCVSHWGHDFRPDYMQLSVIKQALGNPPVLALTATATPAVQEDVRRVLSLQDAPLFHTGIERDNLFVSVHDCHGDDDKLARAETILQRTGGPAILYFALIQDLLRTESLLMRRGHKPLVYHGDLSAHERSTQQKAFEQSRDALILATNAFGMGVDKSDIRAIVHWQIPKTLEAYYQEIGRAGRDGQGSFCELLWNEEDLQIQRNFVEWANPGSELLQEVAAHLQALGERIQALDRDDLVGTFFGKNRRDGRIDTCLRLLRTAGCVTGDLGKDLAFVRMPTPTEAIAWLPADKRTNDLQGLLAMVRYASASTCRKQSIHAHFGFELAVPCGSCDLCTDGDAFIDRRLPSVRTAIAPVGSDQLDDLPVQRGDWIEVQGMGLCCVRRVHKTRNSLRADVERMSDLEERSVDLMRRPWRKVEH